MFSLAYVDSAILGEIARQCDPTAREPRGVSSRRPAMPKRPGAGRRAPSWPHSAPCLLRSDRHMPPFRPAFAHPMVAWEGEIEMDWWWRLLERSPIHPAIVAMLLLQAAVLLVIVFGWPSLETFYVGVIALLAGMGVWRVAAFMAGRSRPRAHDSPIVTGLAPPDLSRMRQQRTSWLSSVETSRSFRLLRIVEPIGILVAIVASFQDLQTRNEARNVAAWQLLTMKASGNSGKIEKLFSTSMPRDGSDCSAGLGPSSRVSISALQVTK